MRGEKESFEAIPKNSTYVCTVYRAYGDEVRSRVTGELDLAQVL